MHVPPPTTCSSSGAAENQFLNQKASQQEIQQPQQPAMQKSRPSNPSFTAEPIMISIPYMMAIALNSNNLRRHHNNRPKILRGLMLAKSSILKTTIQYIMKVAKDKEIMGRDNREDDVFICPRIIQLFWRP